MRCNNCGAEVDNGTVNCPYCGCSVKGDGSSVTVYSAESEDIRAEEQKRHEEVFGENPFADKEYHFPKQELGLKWANFLGYFSLWISALYALGMAVTAFRGEQYGGSAELVYSYFGNALRYTDRFYGAALVLGAVVYVVAAMAIIKFKATAVKLVPAIYLYGAVVSTAYCILVSIVIKHSVFNAPEVLTVVVGIIFFFVNRTYFNNRKHIFVN